ncbi:hypothetical protein [Streptomyces sp. NPDC005752]|uniref:hypothetical protein n=1 Tax=Streptomyces sp. NPDC005752 TaxID=3157065 RepID=UPI0033DD2F3D
MNRSASRGLVRVSLALGAAAASTVLVATVGVAAPAVPAGSTGTPAATQDSTQRGCAVVYFDLGETLVHTAEDESVNYRSGASAYLRDLRERHIKVGLITNVPSSWGESDAERADALKKEVDSGWKGPTPFAWDDFGDRILTPRTEAERKPAPALWERAEAGSGGCRLVYEAETAEEIDAATSLGYLAYQVGQPSRPDFLPARLIELLAHLPR